MPREPDRFDAQAEALVDKLFKVPAFDSELMEIAAALRAEHASALQASIDACDDAIGALQGDREVEAALECIKRIRALLPPAAAPAAETGKAQGTEASDIGYDADSDRFVRESVYLAAQKRIAELEAKYTSAEEQVSELLAVIEHPRVRPIADEIAARAAPPEGEGK